MSMNSFSLKFDRSRGLRAEPADAPMELEKLENKAVELHLLKKSAADPRLGRRMNPRFRLRLPVVVFWGTTSFRTESLNLSMGGILLRDPLPEPFMNEVFEVLISFQDPHTEEKSQLLFRARAVGPGTASSRLVLEPTPPRILDSLSGLFSGLNAMT